MAAISCRPRICAGAAYQVLCLSCDGLLTFVPGDEITGAQKQHHRSCTSASRHAAFTGLSPLHATSTCITPDTATANGLPAAGPEQQSRTPAQLPGMSPAHDWPGQSRAPSLHPLQGCTQPLRVPASGSWLAGMSHAACCLSSASAKGVSSPHGGHGQAGEHVGDEAKHEIRWGKRCQIERAGHLSQAAVRRPA